MHEHDRENNCAALEKLAALHSEDQKRLEKLEVKYEQLSRDIAAIITHNAETKIYIKQILERFDMLEKKILDMNSTKAENENLLKTSSNERSRLVDKFLEFSKYIVTATVGAVIAYIIK